MRQFFATAILTASRSAIVGLLLLTLCGPLSAQPVAMGTRVVVVSDLNESYGSTRYSPEVDAAVRQTIELAPDLVISTGDMVAGQRLSPPLNKDEIQAMWQAFDHHVTTPLARAGLPFATTPGNHDASRGARFVIERELYRAQWLPRKPVLDFVDAADYPFNYAGYKDGVRFVSQACLGAAPRALLGTTHPGHRAITVLELEDNGYVRIEAYHGMRFDRPIPRSTLPEKITAHGVTLVRDDLGLPDTPVGGRPAAR